MFEYNDGIGINNIIQNQFTSYVTKSARNTRLQYLKKKYKRMQYEISLELQLDYIECDCTNDDFNNFSIIDQIENQHLYKILKEQKEIDLYILFSKVIKNYTFEQISSKVGMGYKAVSMRYYRMIKKIKKEFLGGEDK